MVDVSINKKIWDGLPPDLKAILVTATDALAYDLVFKLKKLDLAAVAEAKKDPTIEIVDMAPDERRKFRQIAQQEWANWAKRNAMTDKIYKSVTTFLAERNLL
jgi:TRAP-type C4-dicarboxylate transport system substrate-binding protein